MSVFSGMKGEKIANECVTAYDDGSIPNEWGSNNLDDEGLKPRKNELIKDGILTGYLVDSFNGRRMNELGNGCSRRQNYKFEPTSRMSNTYIANGKSTKEEIIAATKLGIYAVSIKNGLENVCSVGGRMEILKTELKNHKNCVLIKDCYNANLDSMLKVLDFCQNLDKKSYGKKIFVLADMKELGDESEKSHKAVGEKINSIFPDFVFLIGKEMKACYDVIKNTENVLLFDESSPENFEIIGEKILEKVNGNEIVLLKGSHSMELDKLIPYFVLLKNEGEIQ